MSWGAFIFGLVVSVLVHVWLLRLPPGAEAPPAPQIVPIVETELARLDPPAQEPAAQPPPPEAPPEDSPPPPDPAPSEAAEPEPPPPDPQPHLTKVAEARQSDTEQRGDFAGAAEGQRAPELRINWGTDKQALAVLNAGGMLIVVLEGEGPRPLITHKVERQGSTWRRAPFQPAGATAYSNRLRIVDHVPAFSEVRNDLLLKGGQRLAVLIPTDVERMLESAQMQAAFRVGLAMAQIDNFAARFTLRQGSLALDITHVGATGRSAMP